MAKPKAPKRNLESYSVKHMNKSVTIKGKLTYFILYSTSNFLFLFLNFWFSFQLGIVCLCVLLIHPNPHTLQRSKGSKLIHEVLTLKLTSGGITGRRSQSVAGDSFTAQKSFFCQIILMFRVLIQLKESVLFMVSRATLSLMLLVMMISSVDLSTILLLVLSILIELQCEFIPFKNTFFLFLFIIKFLFFIFLKLGFLCWKWNNFFFFNKKFRLGFCEWQCLRHNFIRQLISSN